MAERDRELGEFIRRSLHAAAESVMIGHAGLDRIHARLAAVRLADAADPVVIAHPDDAGGTVLAGMGGADPQRL
jgi:hypothetical protein